VEEDKVKSIFEKYLGKDFDYKKHINNDVVLTEVRGTFVDIVLDENDSPLNLTTSFIQAIEYLAKDDFLNFYLGNKITFVKKTEESRERLNEISEYLLGNIKNIQKMSLGIDKIIYVAFANGNVAVSNIIIEPAIRKSHSVK
jgi:hypothetical protein